MKFLFRLFHSLIGINFERILKPFSTFIRAKIWKKVLFAFHVHGDWKIFSSTRHNRTDWTSPLNFTLKRENVSILIIFSCLVDENEIFSVLLIILIFESAPSDISRSCDRWDGGLKDVTVKLVARFSSLF